MIISAKARNHSVGKDRESGVLIGMKQELLDKIASRKARVAVIGLGYVGLPLAVEKAAAGFTTVGFDVQADKVAQVNAGRNYIGDVIDDDLGSLVQSGLLSATTDFGLVAEADFIAICVPTPLDEHQQPDVSYIDSSVRAIAQHLKPKTMVVLESTTYPGTTEELVRPLLEKGSGLVCGEDFYLGFSPERVDPGNAVFKTRNTPKVVGAIGADATEVIAAMYRTVLKGEIVEVSSPRIAEMEKLLENAYRNVNIGLINELAILCDRMDINIWEVVDAAKSKPYGFQAFYPGPGLGGHCIPLDPQYLSWKAREYGFHISMLEASASVNDSMPAYCVSRVSRILNRQKKALNGSRVLVSGVAYKQDIDDYRESPALKVIKLLEEEGAEVEVFDPWVARFRLDGKERETLPELSAETVEQADLVLVTAAHTNVDYPLIQRHARAIFDTKNALATVTPRENIEVL
jgi:UDP-N-acetyl-D-glucosamine dehydrogenase